MEEKNRKVDLENILENVGLTCGLSLPIVAGIDLGEYISNTMNYGVIGHLTTDIITTTLITVPVAPFSVTECLLLGHIIGGYLNKRINKFNNEHYSFTNSENYKNNKHN
jgi:hypothetical protein